MQCFVYKSLKQPGTYLYLPRADDFDALPDALLSLLGALVYVLEFELTPQRELAQEDAVNVLASIENRGFHLQMPPAQPRDDERRH